MDDIKKLKDVMVHYNYSSNMYAAKQRNAIGISFTYCGSQLSQEEIFQAGNIACHLFFQNDIGFL